MGHCLGARDGIHNQIAGGCLSCIHYLGSGGHMDPCAYPDPITRVWQFPAREFVPPVPTVRGGSPTADDAIGFSSSPAAFGDTGQQG